MAEWNTRVLDFMGRKPVRWVLIGATTAAVMSFVIWRYPPVQSVPRGEVAVRKRSDGARGRTDRQESVIDPENPG